MLLPSFRRLSLEGFTWDEETQEKMQCLAGDYNGAMLSVSGEQQKLMDEENQQ